MAKFTQMAPASRTARDGSDSNSGGGPGGAATAGVATAGAATAATPKEGSTRMSVFGPRQAAGPEAFRGAKFREHSFLDVR